MIKSILGILSGFFTWLSDRNKAKNAPDVKEAQKGQDEVNAVNKLENAVAKKDLDAVRKEISE